MINSTNNFPSTANNLQTDSLGTKQQISSSVFNPTANLSQLPIMQLLFSLIISILQQLLSQLMQQANTDKPEQPDNETPGATDSGNPSPLNNISDNQNAKILILHKDIITPEIIDYAEKNDLTRPYVISDEDGSGSISAGDFLLVGSQAEGNFQKRVLSADDISLINSPGAIDSGNPSPLNNINNQQDVNIRFLFKDLITPEIIERTKDFTRPYVISDDDNSGSISVGDRLLVGDNIHGDLQEHKLTVDDLGKINGGSLGTSNN
ncbi:hypothetical protein [uncultured Thiothrix sp.]|uniref:hypothetical protein n=1 Tax=uncultured Thiothrix sp. TaxID=223185 RepID=UPI00260945CF|nr:hypothetical protein [uncultured Thiothrix sp.]